MTYVEIKNLLQSIDDPAMKLEMVMDLGGNLSPVPEGATCSEIVGCASHVEICIDANKFYGRADSALVRGIVAILIAMLDGKTISEIKEFDILSEFATLDINLGAGRLNGLESMVRFFHNL